MRIRPTRIRRNTAPNHGCDECVASVHARRRRRWSLLVKIEEDEEEEAVFISGVNTNEDPPNAHQAQYRPIPRVR